MTRFSLSLKQARKLILLSQGIHRPRDFGSDKASALNAITRLSYVQIDTISVVERAHHHVIWSRSPSYKPEWLNTLMAEKKVFEYWSHAAAYLPMQDYRYSLPRKQALRSTDKHWHTRDTKVAKFVLDRITAEGPLQAKDFERAVATKGSGWWDWKPAKIALEQLFMEGELMVLERRGFQKVYDLAERVLPSWVDTSSPTSEDLSRHLIERFLLAHGIGLSKQISYLRKGLKSDVETQCRNMLDEGVIVEVSVAGKEYYALADFEALLGKPLSRTKVIILSPFDNLLIQRKRMQDLFAFRYQIECYVPARKRIYGYFVLPLLWGQAFAGRMDVKNDRKTGVMIVRHLSIEVVKGDDFIAALRPALAKFMSFNCASCVKVERITSPNDLFDSAVTQQWTKILESL